MSSPQPREFTTEDGSVYRGVPADEFPDLSDVDHRESLTLRTASAARSQNGLSANDRSLIASFQVPGSSRRLALRKGPMSVVLLDFFGFWHQEIEPIDTGTLDDWGYAERTIRGSSTTLSNHASGSAGDANALRHVLGKAPEVSLSKAQIKAIRNRIPLYRGTARWGGDYAGRKDVMHAEGDQLRNLEQVAAQIQTGWLAPGVRSYLTGAGQTPGATIPTAPEDDMTPDQATLLGNIGWTLNQIKPVLDGMAALLQDEDAQTDRIEWGLLDEHQGARAQIAGVAGQVAGLGEALRQVSGGGAVDLTAVTEAAAVGTRAVITELAAAVGAVGTPRTAARRELHEGLQESLAKLAAGPTAEELHELVGVPTVA